eukprot:TRINITY_DN866_c0_g1_i17.p1 TRINITY_DN866_c0_g1~~TRINITY_DN866_c0_g1_i17.p1  ORF type:complete len:353 (+),score=42.99 TRINITY_DN866_c0_g1_i17:85-1143(+)
MSVEIKDSDTYDEAIIDGLDPQEVEIDSWLERLNSPSLEDVSITLEFLSMSEWIPWMDPQTNKNKQRFAERGGIERIGSLLGDPNMSIDIRRECIVNLRNFCETPNLFRYVFRAGIIPCLLPLLRSDLLVTDVTGLLFGILEFDSQAHICPCYGKEFVRELVLECERVNRMTKNRNSDVSFDQHRSIMGCLLALSLNDLSNSALFALGGAEALMCQNSDILTQYLSCIGTAFLLANRNHLPDSFIHRPPPQCLYHLHYRHHPIPPQMSLPLPLSPPSHSSSYLYHFHRHQHHRSSLPPSKVLLLPLSSPPSAFFLHLPFPSIPLLFVSPPCYSSNPFLQQTTGGRKERKKMR